MTRFFINIFFLVLTCVLFLAQKYEILQSLVKETTTNHEPVAAVLQKDKDGESEEREEEEPEEAKAGESEEREEEEPEEVKAGESEEREEEEEDEEKAGGSAERDEEEQEEEKVTESEKREASPGNYDDSFREDKKALKPDVPAARKVLTVSKPMKVGDDRFTVLDASEKAAAKKLLDSLRDMGSSDDEDSD
jgi:hypothetical protein